MRSFVPWMTQLDERTLEQLTSEGAATSWEVGFELSGTVTPGRVTERCEVLFDAELVELEDRDIGFDRVETIGRSRLGGGFT